MNLIHISTHPNHEKLSAYFERLQSIFADMDLAYEKASEHYGFRCNGCEDNCCLTRFYHHTYLECLYIGKGFGNLKSPEQNAILAGAKDVCRQSELADKQKLPVRLMCPLNEEGRCRLYHHRPMICRLHGIPHELYKPGQPVIHGPGCGDFDKRCGDKSYFKFDRTPFYFEMAKLENEFKQASGLSGKIRLTIAEMILEFGIRNSEFGIRKQQPGLRHED
jgi:Fe-S-cluster containining protein